MSSEQIKQLFIDHCLSKDELVFLSKPMDSRINGKYEAFKIGLLLGEKA